MAFYASRPRFYQWTSSQKAERRNQTQEDPNAQILLGGSGPAGPIGHRRFYRSEWKRQLLGDVDQLTIKLVPSPPRDVHFRLVDTDEMSNSWDWNL